MTYAPEQRAADAEIALAMGWQQVQLAYLNAEQYAVVPPEWENTTRNQLEFCGADLYRLVPRFHESHDARAALLIWVEQQSLTFRRKLLGELSWGLGNSLEHGKPTDEDEVFSAMLATPAQVAEAALKVIQENNK